MSKEQNKMIFHQGQMLNTIEDNVGNAEIHIQSAVNEINQAKDIQTSNDGLVNKVLYIIVIIVVILILIMLILPD